MTKTTTLELVRGPLQSAQRITFYADELRGRAVTGIHRRFGLGTEGIRAVKLTLSPSILKFIAPPLTCSSREAPAPVTQSPLW